ncbi:MAG: DUF2264 domain-containing protein [Clostridia bacterium]
MKKEYKMKTKNDTAKVLLDMIRPLKPFYSEGKGWLKVADTGVHYGEKTSRMEGFTRVAWGLGPLWAGAEDLEPELQAEANEWLELYHEGMTNGSNPNHPEYWGKPYDFDQKLVEMAALVTAITLCPEKVWEPLTQEAKDNMYTFLNQTNCNELHANNWRYFRILVNMTFLKLGLPYDAERMRTDRELIESCYIGDGWYYDGSNGQIDYYIPFAMHFYGLIFAKVMEDVDPEYCKTLKERSVQFIEDYVYWYGNDGNEIPFGRSLTYRFAHSSFFAAMAFADLEGEKASYGVMKRLTLRNIENWVNRPIFDTSGVLSIGYGYPNLVMTERYNAGGSPYWAFKAFLMLALPASHSFWTAEEADYEYEARKSFDAARMLITHDEDHVLSYSTPFKFPGRAGKFHHKYGKLVYSNQFGFSVARESDLVSGAFDNTLVASLAGDNNYAMRANLTAYELSDVSVKTNYNLLHCAQVKTILVPFGAWHVRIHKINTDVAIDIADGGFSIEAERCFNAISGDLTGKYTPEELHINDESAFAVLPWGVSGVVTLSGGKPIVTDCMPNTNLLFNTSILPMSTKSLEAGEHVIITCVFGDRSEKAAEKMKNVPQVEVCGDKFIIRANGEEITESFID